MSKIVQAVNAMITNKEQISAVRKEFGVYFFLYKGKHKWSISHLEDKDDYILTLYPVNLSLENLITKVNMEGTYFIDNVPYNSGELATKEAHDTFRELHTIVREKLFEVDKVLDEIISDDAPF